MDGGAQGEYFEAQDAAWCGMHALNNLLGGPYVTKDACGLAARRVANELSQVGGADQETISLHLHPGTGWLSIDVINVLGASTLGVHVEGSEHPLALLKDADGAAAFLVNCNQQHWTVLQRAHTDGAWVHTNSIITELHLSFHGRRRFPTWVDLLHLMADLKQYYGDVTLQQVRRASPLKSVFTPSPRVAANGAPGRDLEVKTVTSSGFPTHDNLFVIRRADGLVDLLTG